MKKKLITGIMSVVIAFTALTGCGSVAGSKASASSRKTTASSDAAASKSSGSLTNVRLGIMTGYVDQIIAIVAQQKGFYKENGLNVTTSEYAAGINTVDAATTDQIDIGLVADYAYVNRIGNTAGDSELRLIANFASSSNTSLYVNPKTVKSLSDLKGKNIIELPGTVWEYWAALSIQSAGLTTKDVHLTKVSSNAEALAVAQSGEGDAFWANGEPESKLQELGWKKLQT